MHLHKEVQVTTENAIKCNLTSTELVMLKAGKQRCFVFFSLALLTIQLKKYYYSNIKVTYTQKNKY